TALFRNPGFDVSIAVIDTAAVMDHPDLLRSSLMTRNFAGRRGNPEEEQHGTAVVGLIAAIASHDQGLNGAAPGADVHLLRGCWQSAQGPGRCNTLTLALALDAAIDLQPDILNLSLTGRNDRFLDELLTILLANGTLVIAAHDDERAPSARFPLDHDGVVYAYGVADGEGVRTAISAPTPNLLFAPRHAVSLAPMGEYDLVSGHSIATPQLAAMAARLIQEESDHSRTDTINALQVWLNQYYRRLPAE
ncbi:MAG: S8 family serine peptidase, partial [Pseudomonadota bacterium]